MSIKLFLAILLIISYTGVISAAACNVANCLTCTTTDSFTCAVCNTGYKIVSGQCASNTCTVQYCLVCDSVNTSLCKVCGAGYKVNALGVCTAIICYDSNCEFCPTSTNNCSRCKLDYFVEKNTFDRGDCIKKCDFYRCKECRNNTIATEYQCVQCESRYVLNSERGYCSVAINILDEYFTWILVGSIIGSLLVFFGILCFCIKCVCGEPASGSGTYLVEQSGDGGMTTSYPASNYPVSQNGDVSMTVSTPAFSGGFAMTTSSPAYSG